MGGENVDKSISRNQSVSIAPINLYELYLIGNYQTPIYL